MEINTVYDLKYAVKETGSHFFDRQSMKFFGDTMKNYGLRKFKNYYELYRKHAVKAGSKSSAYFDKKTLKFSTVVPKEVE